jgi:hypothetical protein
MSPETVQKWLETAEKFVKLVAENWRSGTATRRSLIVGGIAFFIFNPGVAGQISATLFAMKELPNWYPTAF